MAYGVAGLVLRRRKGERIFIGEGEDRVVVTVLSTGSGGGAVALGFDAPEDVEILREELAER
jgi:carbon storage regulator CsrA